MLQPFLFLFPLMYLAFIVLVLFIVYKIVDNWVNRIAHIRREQTEVLREIAKMLRERGTE